MDSNWDYVLERAFNEEIEVLKENLAQGGGENPGTYQYICGKIRGIRFAMEQLFQIRDRIQQKEDAGWTEVGQP